MQQQRRGTPRRFASPSRSQQGVNLMKYPKRLCAVLIAVVGLVSSPLATAAGEAAASDKPYPVADYARLPDYTGAVLSPNGQHLAVLVPLNDRSNLAVIDLSTRKSKVLTNIKLFDVLRPRWIGNERLVFTLGQSNSPTGPGAFEGGGLFMVTRDGSDSRVLEPTVREARASQSKLRYTEFMSRLPGNDKEVLVSEYGRTSDGADVYRLDITTGRRTLLTFTRPERVYDYVLDNKQVPRVARSSVKDELTTIVWYRDGEDAPWREIARQEGPSRATSPQAFERIAPLAFESDDRTLIVASNSDRDTMAIRKYDVEKKVLGETLAAHPRFDMGADSLGASTNSLIRSQSKGEVLGFRVEGERRQIVWTDERLARMQTAVDQALSGRVNELQPSDSDRVLVTSYSDLQPSTYFIYDDKAKTMEQVASSMSWIKPDHLTEVRPFALKTRDGLEIPSFYLLPRSYKAGQKLPTVVHIHGGPTARPDRWAALWEGGFGVAEAQLLASRGYAVIVPNFRSTPGLGKRVFLEGRHSIGRAMSEDHEDAAKWAIEQGFADPQRICMSGASYGGYATLRALAKTPKLFRCGVAGLVVSDLELQVESTAGDTAYSTTAQAFWRTFLIGEDQAPGTARKMSPVHQATDIKAPLFFYAGAADIRTPIEQTNRMVSALRSTGQSPEVLIKAEEGHGFGKLENRIELWERTLAFLARQLDGKPAR
jgi:dipeptidyl aminopeptidase/acylaminoacyl peptidase